MKRVIVGLSLVGIIGLSTGFLAYAQEEAAPLEEIVVKGERLVKPTKQTSETVYTGKEITRKGMEIEGSKAETSVYEAADMLPGISVESPDPFGLAAEQRNVRVRGVRSSLGAMSVEGVPNYGGNPIGPREYIYDMENMQGIAVYKGAIPADLGTGVGGRGGVFELRPRWPEKNFGFDMSQAYGSHNYMRSFVRLDSGILPCTTGTRFSTSYSYTDAEKWKGPGDLGPRNNVNIMFTQPTVGEDEVKLWFNFNDVEQDLYRPLTYSQVRHLDRNYYLDYNDSLSRRGTAAQQRLENINYYRYNRADLTNIDLLSVIPVTLSENFKLTFKPYYSKEDSNVFNGATIRNNTDGQVTKRIRDIERYGVVSEATANFAPVQATLGYWVESVGMTINTENFRPGDFAFQGFGILTDQEDNAIVHSPYLKLAGKFGAFDWQAGLKYFYFVDPATKGFTTPAPMFQPVRARDLDRDEKDYEEFLPSAGLAYNFTDSIMAYASYGRTLIRPYSYVPLINLYNNNRPAFQAAGVTLNDLFNGYAPEISDNFEVGARFRTNLFEIMPSFFYSMHDNLLTTIFDPRIGRTGVNYQQNIGKATGIGVELDTSFFIKDYLTFFLNPSYTSLTYDEDLAFAGNTLYVKGNQVVDTPEWLVKSGLIFKYRGFEIVPMFRYLGERFGDVEHRERVGDHFLVDLMLSYTKKDFLKAKDMRFSLEFYNLFDKKYVSVINVSDDNRGGGTSYYTGAPFTVVARASMKF